MSKIIEWTRAWTTTDPNGLKVWFEAVTTSTNEIAKEQPGFDLYLTNHQTSGRGRGINTWSDDSNGGNLVSSWSFNIKNPPSHISGPVFGLAVHRAVNASWSALNWRLKAPNDIYIGDNKLAGILLESTSQGAKHRLVFGIGMNISKAPAIIKNSTCLNSCLEAPVDEKKWRDFLDKLSAEIQWASVACQKQKMDESVCKELSQALSAEIDANGNIKTASGITHWSKL